VQSAYGSLTLKRGLAYLLHEFRPGRGGGKTGGQISYRRKGERTLGVVRKPVDEVTQKAFLGVMPAKQKEERLGGRGKRTD